MKKLIDDNEKEISEINMTPFVDIVLVILIIFMATATFIVEGKIPVNLPKAETGENKEISSKKIEISIKKDGSIYVDGKKVNRKLLEEYLSDERKKSDVVILRADKKTPFENIVFVVDICRKIGLEKYMIETEKVEKQ